MFYSFFSIFKVQLLSSNITIAKPPNTHKKLDDCSLTTWSEFCFNEKWKLQSKDLIYKGSCNLVSVNWGDWLHISTEQRSLPIKWNWVSLSTCGSIASSVIFLVPNCKQIEENLEKKIFFHEKNYHFCKSKQWKKK